MLCLHLHCKRWLIVAWVVCIVLISPRSSDDCCICVVFHWQASALPWWEWLVMARSVANCCWVFCRSAAQLLSNMTNRIKSNILTLPITKIQANCQPNPRSPISGWLLYVQNCVYWIGDADQVDCRLHSSAFDWFFSAHNLIYSPHIKIGSHHAIEWIISVPVVIGWRLDVGGTLPWGVGPTEEIQPPFGTPWFLRPRSKDSC